MRPPPFAILGGLTVAAGIVLGAAGLPGAHTSFYPLDAPPGTVDVAVDGVRDITGAQLVEDGKQGNRLESSREFRATGYGVSAVLAIDASGSVKGGQFEMVKQALRDFVSASRPQDRIAVVAFADTVDVRQTFTADKTQLTRAIDALQAGGRFTLLNQAIGNSLTLLATEKTNARKHLLVITDGKNEGPGPDPAALERSATGGDIAVDCIGVTRLAPRFLIPMQSLAAASGGAYVRARSYDELRNAMREGIEGLLGSPVLRFRLSHIEPDGASHLLQLNLPGRSTAAVQVFLPGQPAPSAILYFVAGVAVVLFCCGALLILYRKRWRTTPVPDPAPARPGLVPPVAAPSARPHTKTVFAPPVASGKADALRPAPVKSTPPPAPPVSPRPQTPVRDATQFRQTFPAPAKGRPAAWLKAEENGTRFPIDSAEVWIGAGEGNQIQATGAVISRNHACIQWAGGDLYLFDNRSTNGTRVNGKPVEAGVRIRLQGGERITIGHLVFLLEV